MASSGLLVARMNSLEPILDRIKNVFDSLLNIKIPDFVFLVLISIILVFMVYLFVSYMRWKQRVRTNIIAIEKSLGIREQKLRLDKKEDEVKEEKAGEEVREEKMKEEVQEEMLVEEKVELKKEEPIEEEAQAEEVPEVVHPEEVVEPEEKAQLKQEVQPKQRKEEPLAGGEEPERLTEEQTFILSSIADEPERTYQEDALYKVYHMTFEQKERPAFNMDIRSLEEHDFIQPDESSGYKVWLRITDKGLEYIKRQQKK